MLPDRDFVEPKTVVIPEGEYLMGSDLGAANEAPVHRVWIDSFALATLPITNKEYSLFIQASGRRPPPFWDTTGFRHADQPVVGPSWYDAMAYCEWIRDMTSKLFRLPTEAEREKAARGGLEGQEYPWGNKLPADSLGGRNSQLSPVGTEGPNGYGLYNMSEGIHEWCADVYDARYYESSPRRNPKGAAHGNRRVARGGSWRHRVRFARCASRSSLAPAKQFSDFGFRCAMTIE